MGVFQPFSADPAGGRKAKQKELNTSFGVGLAGKFVRIQVFLNDFMCQDLELSMTAALVIACCGLVRLGTDSCVQGIRYLNNI